MPEHSFAHIVLSKFHFPLTSLRFPAEMENRRVPLRLATNTATMRLLSTLTQAATLVVAASAALALIIIVGREHRTALAGLDAVTGLDADDVAFFSASKTFANEGDRELLRANEAMGDKDLKLALHLSRDAEHAYRKGLSDRRLAVAEKVEQQLSAGVRICMKACV